MDKNIKMGNLRNFRGKKCCHKKNVVFAVVPSTNENKIKTLKKSLFMQNFVLYLNCTYYTCKRRFCVKCR